MAKGNLFQGMARGKVGDVVFYRMNGVQMSRVRNRTPKNPRSVEQLYQRAIIASVMKMYSAGKQIFDHAFQGYTVGEGCMRRFNSVNARILRSQITNDIDNSLQLVDQVGRVVPPKSISFTPLANIMISEGTLEQNLFAYDSKTNNAPPPGGGGARAVETNNNFRLNVSSGDYTTSTTVNSLLAKMGVYAGDIFTIVMCNINTDDITFQMPATSLNYATQYKAFFEWIRFIVKSDISDTLTVATATFADVFDIESNLPNTTFNASQKFIDAISFTFRDGYQNATIGCIRSRFDVDLRSTSYMHWSKTALFGIASSYIIDVWQLDVSKIGVSDLILEGGEGYATNQLAVYGAENEPIIPAPVDEAEVPTPARHAGTRNNKK